MCNKYFKTLGIISYFFMGANLCEVMAMLQNEEIQKPKTNSVVENIEASKNAKSVNFAPVTLNLQATPIGPTIQAQPAVTPQFIQTLLEQCGPLEAYAKLMAMIEEKLKSMKDDLEWINDLCEEIEKKLRNTPEMKNDVKNLIEKALELNRRYENCYKELVNEFHKDCKSVLLNCIQNIQELQEAIQAMRITLNRILEIVRGLILKSKNKLEIQFIYKNGKIEAKLCNVYNNAMDEKVKAVMKVIDPIIEMIIIPAKQTFNQKSTEERNKGISTTQSSRKI